MTWVHIGVVPDFEPGDPPPTGYNAWHEWAEVQHNAGLRQERCGKCICWKYPQELSGKIIVSHPVDSRGAAHRMESPICLKCNTAKQ